MSFFKFFFLTSSQTYATIFHEKLQVYVPFMLLHKIMNPKPKYIDLVERKSLAPVYLQYFVPLVKATGVAEPSRVSLVNKGTLCERLPRSTSIDNVTSQAALKWNLENHEHHEHLPAIRNVNKFAIFDTLYHRSELCWAVRVIVELIWPRNSLGLICWLQKAAVDGSTSSYRLFSVYLRISVLLVLSGGAF